MPREPLPLIRSGGFKNAEKLYVLAFEGTVSEKKYFEDFRNSEYFNLSGLIETVPLKRKKGDGASDPFSVKKLLKTAKTEYSFKLSDEFWLIIDRDDWQTKHKIDFEKLVKECKEEKNFFLAMSNHCFEIWLILHLKDLQDFTKEEQDCILANKKLGNKNYIDKILEDLQGKGYNKRPNTYIFLPFTKNAIERAKLIDNPQDDYPKGIGTHLYKLVEKLIDNKWLINN